jgi:aerobic-type carbon monoxide dehydrogenase small subunit (CoxS/CutS family)
MAAYVLLDELQRAPVAPDAVDAAVMRAVGNNICRCTGYVRYFTAIRRVVFQQPGLVRGQ